MKPISRIILFGALTLVLLIAACAPEEGTPTVVGTLPDDLTVSPPVLETETPGTPETETVTAETPEATATEVTATEVTATETTGTPGTPVTGVEVILLECQFCLDGMGNAVLVIPEAATFEVVTTAAPDTGCTSVDTFGGRQVVLCRGEENTTLTLDICTDTTNCTQLEIELQPCPETGTPAPGATDTPGAGVPTDTTTPTPGGPTDTPGGPTSTPTPTP